MQREVSARRHEPKLNHAFESVMTSFLARAERLAKAILDQQTTERLQAFAAECRAALQVLTRRAA